MTLYQDKYRIGTARLRGWDYRTPGWYFVTICVRNHACVLGQIVDRRMWFSTAGQVAHSEMRSLPAHYTNVSIDSFVVMPNHVHATVVIGGQHRYSPNSEVHLNSAVGTGRSLMPPKAGSLSAIVRSYKAGVTCLCHQLGLSDFAWQLGFYEHIVRSNASLNAIRDYIEKNPANWSQDRENP